MSTGTIKNFIPWRAVWKEGSSQHPAECRYSLNDILAKGRNNINKLQEILIIEVVHQVGYHSDVSKMFNCVKLDQQHWCLQRYIWQGELDKKMIPREKVIKTLIYGVKSSGNLAENCIRKTSSLSKAEYPEVDKIVHKDFYADDCISGEDSMKLANQRADQLKLVLNKGGFFLKGITFSGKNPPRKTAR